jgi:predicted RNA-binding protein associated with RNAse of E/G family
MKRKFLDRPNWRRVLKRRFYETYVENEEFCGHLSAIYLDSIKEPLIIKMVGRDYCLVDNGFIWLQFLPRDKNYCLTAMIDRQRRIVQWYYDVTKQNYLDEEGTPYFDDLYLDVVLLYTGEVLLLDEDELEEALESKHISRDEYDLAYKESNRIIESINMDKLIEFTNRYLTYLEETIK